LSKAAPYYSRVPTPGVSTVADGRQTS
jgi:hypothetical protein